MNRVFQIEATLSDELAQLYEVLMEEFEEKKRNRPGGNELAPCCRQGSFTT